MFQIKCKMGGRKQLKNMFINNGIRFKKIIDRERNDGYIDSIYYDYKKRSYAIGVNRSYRGLGFVGATMMISAYDKFINRYGNPFDQFFSPKIKISLIILIPIIDIVFTIIVNYVNDNKESNFKSIKLSDEEVIRSYKKIYLKI